MSQVLHADQIHHQVHLRRCPGCRNMVERDSIACPVCGRSYAEVMTRRLVRWVLLLALVAWLVYRLVLGR